MGALRARENKKAEIPFIFLVFIEQTFLVGLLCAKNIATTRLAKADVAIDFVFKLEDG